MDNDNGNGTPHEITLNLDGPPAPVRAANLTPLTWEREMEMDLQLAARYEASADRSDEAIRAALKVQWMDSELGRRLVCSLRASGKLDREYACKLRRRWAWNAED